MSDPLLEAARALRETVTGEQEAIGRATRARVLSELRQQQRRRAVRFTFGLPLAAILVGSGAWAASQPTLPHWVQRVAESCGIRTAPSTHTQSVPGASRKQQPLRTRAATDAPAPPEAPPAASAAAQAISQPVGAVPPAATRAQSRGAGGSAASAVTSGSVRHASDSAATERDLQLYAAAHRLHFQSNDSFAALKAWSEYLTQVPNGRFVVEARYNRAICLVRLGRKREALDALQPFVSGAYGNYRRTEASALMEQLSQEQ